MRFLIRFGETRTILRLNSWKNSRGSGSNRNGMALSDNNSRELELWRMALEVTELKYH